MTSQELRQKYLEFFEKRGHKIIPSASLIPENDKTVHFTTAGMQQFKDYYLNPEKASYVPVTSIQKCLRTSDIEEVGDSTHLTFFEMLGNFSFGYPKIKGSYFKEKAIEYAWEFLTEVLKIKKERISATYFEGNREIPEDKESFEILKKIDGLSLSEIRPQGFDDNFWSLGMEGSPGGPTVEFYIDGIEIWNLVFNEYVFKNGQYKSLEYKGIDTGMGLERLSAVINNKSSVYNTNELYEIVEEVEKEEGLLRGSGRKENEGVDVENRRIISDHIRAAVFLIADGVLPSKDEKGSVLRRLLRDAFDEINKQRRSFSYINVVNKVIDVCGSITEYKNLRDKREYIIKTITEEEKFTKEEYEKRIPRINKRIAVLERYPERLNLNPGGDLKWLKAAFIDHKLDNVSIAAGKFAYHLWNTHRYFKETLWENLTSELKERISTDDFKKGYEIGKKKFQEISKVGAEKKFKGGLADNTEETKKLHTATHLLQAALRQVLGDQVFQKGSNITVERLRFDFSYDEKMTPEQIIEVENLVNKWIAQGIEVKCEEMSYDEARNKGAMGLFKDKYGDKVKVYSIGNISMEMCGGPHVSNTSELGKFKIKSEKASSRGIRRIKAILE